MDLENEIFNARVKNYLTVIKSKVERIIKEHINDVDMTVNFLNGEYYALAQEEFANEYQQGLYDKQCMRIG